MIMKIGTNLRKYRTAGKISQQEMADRLGVERNTYASWETDEADVKSSYIPELAKIFNVEITDLFKQKSSEIIINQANTYTENRENSVNGVILLLTDKEQVDKLIEVLKIRV